MDAVVISAVASCIAACGVFLTGVQGIVSAVLLRQASKIARNNREAIRVVDGKVDVVSENVNGHLSRMTAIVAGIDPVVTKEAARELREDAKVDAAKLVTAAKMAADQLIIDVKPAPEPN